MVRVPKAATLKRYGLTLSEWEEIWHRQGEVCPICKKSPPTGNTHVDHAHVKGWKSMEPEQRKRYVRGILCAFCNYRVATKAINLDKARNLVKYLEEYQKRYEMDVVQKLYD